MGITDSEGRPTPEATSAANRAANKLRKEWGEALSRGQVPLSTVVDMSKSKEFRALEKLRLLTVLSARPGWTTNSAREALSHYQIDSRANIGSIRRNAGKLEMFSTLLQATANSWRPAVKYPEGWPWRGKLSLLCSENGITPPDASAPPSDDDADLLARLGGGVEDQEPDDDTDLLDRLGLGGQQ